MRKKAVRVPKAVVVLVTFGRAILGVHAPIGSLVEGISAFDPDSTPSALGSSSTRRGDVPGPDRCGGREPVLCASNWPCFRNVRPKLAVPTILSCRHSLCSSFKHFRDSVCGRLASEPPREGLPGHRGPARDLDGRRECTQRRPRQAPPLTSSSATHLQLSQLMTLPMTPPSNAYQSPQYRYQMPQYCRPGSNSISPSCVTGFSRRLALKRK